MKYILILFSFMFSHATYATSCPVDTEKSAKKMLADADVAVLARVIEMKLDFSIRKDKYLVLTVIGKKGSFEKEMLIWTEGKCRAKFIEGEEYVIFLTRKDKKLWTDVGRIWKVRDKTAKLTMEFLEMKE